MIINSYSADVFSRLSGFRDAEKLAEEKNEAIDKLGEVIVRHGMEDIVGICLLHKHFDLSNEEKLIRHVLKNKILISPKVHIEAIPYMWTFVEGEIFPVEFLEESSITSSFKLKVESLYQGSEFLLNFNKKLVELGVDNLFGLSLIPHSLFSFEENEELIETEDFTSRELLISVIKKDELKKIESTKTLWAFSKKKEGLDCTVHCVVHCMHCAVHC